MAHNLGLRVVAEGVETKAQLTFLKRHRCDEVQGFLFSRPLLSADVIAFLDSRAAMSATGRRRVPAKAAVALVAATATMDEESLGRLLWEESELNAGEADLLPFQEEEDEEDKGRRGLMIFSMAGILIVPVLLGLGAGGGLPPTVQDRVREVIDVAGVRPAERAPVAAPVDAVALPVPKSSARPSPSKRTPGASAGDGSRGRQRSTMGSAAAAGKPSTVTKPKPAPGKKPAKKPATGGGKTTKPRPGQTTTAAPPANKPKGKPATAPGRAKKKKATATASVVNSTPVTTAPLKGKGKAKKP
jgi:hypothetical protein